MSVTLAKYNNSRFTGLHAGFTVRNASDAPLAIGIGAAVVEKTNGAGALHRPNLATHAIVLQPGQAQRGNDSEAMMAHAQDEGTVVVFSDAAHRPRPPSRTPRLDKAGKIRVLFNAHIFSPPVFKEGRSEAEGW